MNATIHVPCPYCAVVNVRHVEISNIIMPMAIWHCDCEIGGCEQPFAVLLMAQPQARTYWIMREKILGAVDCSSAKEKEKPCDPPSSTEAQAS